MFRATRRLPRVRNFRRNSTGHVSATRTRVSGRIHRVDYDGFRGERFGRVLYEMDPNNKWLKCACVCVCASVRTWAHDVFALFGWSVIWYSGIEKKTLWAQHKPYVTVIYYSTYVKQQHRRRWLSVVVK